MVEINKELAEAPDQKKGLFRTFLENRPKNNKYKYSIKVMDFTVWNGIKFGFGLVIGSILSVFTLISIIKIVDIFFRGLMFSNLLSR